MSRSWVGSAVSAAMVLSACFVAPREPDCLADKTCECKRTSDCTLSGSTCVDGKCVVLVDAGIGELGWPCASDGECISGPCLPKGPGNGGICTVPCAADAGFSCPRGWQCKTSFSGAGLVCVPPMASACLPCTADTDCNAAGDRCLPLGSTTFCAHDCSVTTCAAGFTCRAVMLDAGVVRQCIPDLGTCDCSPVTAGLKRSCRTTNPIGTCFGFETCQVDTTFSGCDARDAGREVCDGVDNDCDGLLDQADPQLDTSGLAGFPDCRKGQVCTGKWFCGGLIDAGASFLCTAPDPVAERCNGVDDDCNGTVDDGLTDAMGRYVNVHACDSCNVDCFETLLNLARDGGVDGGGAVLEGAARCDVVAGRRTCVPVLCAKGYYPSPAGQPLQCIKAVPSQCRPCTVTSDCQVPGDECLSVGTDPGKACLQACDVSAPYTGCTGVVGAQGCCPAGNTCELVSGTKRCLPTGNSCLCTPTAVGFTRSCFRSSSTATCVGEQTCNAQGSFGVCDTSRTTIELCDGQDNDCNGRADDPFQATKGTNTYDTDTTCGSCANNCTVRWSKTIQHAVGGCVIDAGVPACDIVQCTTESVSGGGACRVDADCGAGRTCHAVFHQCVRACSMAAPCPMGEVCSASGSCTRACSADADCAPLGSPSRCVAGQCAVAYQFNDTDVEDTNGCECAAAEGGADAPDVSSAYPVAGVPYVDRNCDGVDGVASRSLFVWAQSTSSLGTRTAPFRTIAEAVMAFDPARHDTILVAQGTYVEQVVLRSGVALHGGYSPTFAQRDVVTFPTLIEAPEPTTATRGTVNAEGLSATTVVSGFTIRGYDVISRPAAGQQATSSYAVYVKNAPNLVLRNNHVVGGRGGDAVNASAGPAGANGQNGQNGVPSRECTTLNCTGESQAGASPGVNPACPGTTSGNAGAGSTLSADPQAYLSNANGNGRGGGNGTYRHSDPSQSTFCKYDCVVPTEGLNGGPAQNGADGTASTAGVACSASLGSLGATDWVAAPGGGGADGTPGRGGGGGGAGGCVRNTNPATCTVGNRVGDLGATGGGGGAAGCGGGRGLGGGSGGASIAIFILGTQPTIEGNLIDLGFGGTGGKGGEGGYGGLGGQGGRGGSTTSAAWCAGQGGIGGRGGNGGAGSGGGGGCGGSVFGIAGAGVSPGLLQASNTIAPAPMNPVGAGGQGGASPAGMAFKGGDGAAGVVGLVQAF